MDDNDTLTPPPSKCYVEPQETRADYIITTVKTDTENDRKANKMSDCYRCKWNTASIAEKQKHCIQCDFKDIESLGKHHRITWLDNDTRDDAIIGTYGIQDGGDYWADSGIEDVDQYTLITEFCKHFSDLKLTDRLVLLSMVDNGGNNQGIVTDTGKCLQTVIVSRKRLEKHPYWGKMLRVMGVAPRQTRRRRPRKSE